MNLKTLIIYNSITLFEIFDEIKNKLNINIVNIDQQNSNKLDLSKYENYLIISQYECPFKNYFLIKNLPLKINKILEQINVEYLSNKFVSQASILIGKYELDFNSRTIKFKDKLLNLTEREVDIINFIWNNKKVNLKELQKNVWNYSPELETHTVETHIYRLRKKFHDIFKDDNFINHDKDGYYIN